MEIGRAQHEAVENGQSLTGLDVAAQEVAAPGAPARSGRAARGCRQPRLGGRAPSPSDSRRHSRRPKGAPRPKTEQRLSRSPARTSAASHLRRTAVADSPDWQVHRTAIGTLARTTRPTSCPEGLRLTSTWTACPANYRRQSANAVRRMGPRYLRHSVASAERRRTPSNPLPAHLTGSGVWGGGVSVARRVDGKHDVSDAVKSKDLSGLHRPVPASPTSTR